MQLSPDFQGSFGETRQDETILFYVGNNQQVTLATRAIGRQ